MLQSLSHDELMQVSGGFNEPDNYDPNNPWDLPQFEGPWGGITFNWVNSILESAYGDILVDTDGDGVVDSPEIVVTSNLTTTEITIARHLASQAAFESLALHGAMAGIAGWQAGPYINTLFSRIGLPEWVPAAAGGAYAWTDGSPVDWGEVREKVEGVYYGIIAQDMAQNPEKYENWMIDPFTGEVADRGDLSGTD